MKLPTVAALEAEVKDLIAFDGVVWEVVAIHRWEKGYTSTILRDRTGSRKQVMFPDEMNLSLVWRDKEAWPT